MSYYGTIMDFTVTCTAIGSVPYPARFSVMSPLLYTCLLLLNEGNEMIMMLDCDDDQDYYYVHL